VIGIEAQGRPRTWSSVLLRTFQPKPARWTLSTAEDNRVELNRKPSSDEALPGSPKLPFTPYRDRQQQKQAVWTTYGGAGKKWEGDGHIDYVPFGAVWPRRCATPWYGHCRLSGGLLHRGFENLNRRLEISRLPDRYSQRKAIGKRGAVE